MSTRVGLITSRVRVEEKLLIQAFGSLDEFETLERAADAGEEAINRWSLEGCGDFCARWDEPSFDPDYDTLPLEHFESRVRDLFQKVRFVFCQPAVALLGVAGEQHRLPLLAASEELERRLDGVLERAGLLDGNSVAAE